MCLIRIRVSCIVWWNKNSSYMNCSLQGLWINVKKLGLDYWREGFAVVYMKCIIWCSTAVILKTWNLYFKYFKVLLCIRTASQIYIISFLKMLWNLFAFLTIKVNHITIPLNRLFCCVPMIPYCLCFKGGWPLAPLSQSTGFSVLFSKVVQENPLVSPEASGECSPSLANMHTTRLNANYDLKIATLNS